MLATNLQASLPKDNFKAHSVFYVTSDSEHHGLGENLVTSP